MVEQDFLFAMADAAPEEPENVQLERLEYFVVDGSGLAETRLLLSASASAAEEERMCILNR